MVFDIIWINLFIGSCKMKQQVPVVFSHKFLFRQLSKLLMKKKLRLINSGSEVG